MIEDLVDLHATMLVWASLGGGSISLPYLEQEAFGEIDPRFRFYGFVNDSEFIAACRSRGIKVFGIVFEVQGWEFPVELNEAEDRSMNEMGAGTTNGWLGLREFSQNRYPALWKPIEHYFPDGLFNSDGDKVTDLLEECCSRDIHGQPCHAHWVEAPDREHYCYTMDRNNPVWREYLKAVIRIQIDAGVDGVQLDEAELPMTSMQYGGCFCKDCMKGFAVYLSDHPEVAVDEVPAEERSGFHYGTWLLERGYDFKDDQSEAPLFLTYLRYQRAAITRYFAELTDYARSYGRSQGREVLVSGNFFNVQDHYLPLESEVDVIVTEMRNTTFRQPSWYRYAAGFGGDKPVVVVENPYGGVVPDLISDLRAGKSYDRFRMSMYEAAALGANMSVPYGGWMGSIIEDSFWPPHELCTEIQDFLAEHERLFSRRSAARVAVVFSTESNFVLETRDRALANNTLNLTADDVLPFWSVCDALSDGLQPYDVVFFPDGQLRPDTLTVGDLSRYSTLVLPHCHHMTQAQADAVLGYLADGGRVVRLGPVAANLPDGIGARIEAHDGTIAVEGPQLDALAGAGQVRCSGDIDAALHLQCTGEGVALHLIRYDYDEGGDEVPLLPELTVELELDGAYDSVDAFGAGGVPRATLEREGTLHRLKLEDVPLYSIFELHGSEGGTD
jgi:glycerophosphoryl diester phosphodiesterase